MSRTALPEKLQNGLEVGFESKAAARFRAKLVPRNPIIGASGCFVTGSRRGAALRGLNCPLGQRCSSKLVRSTNKNVDRSALSDFRWASSRLSVILFLITGRLLSICADFEGQGPVQGGSSNTQVFPKRSSNDRTGNSVRCEVDQPKTGASTRTNRSTGSSRQRSRISVHRTSIRHILGSKKCLTTYRRQGRPLHTRL